MPKRFAPICMWLMIAGWPCAGQTAYYGGIWLNNYDANRPIYLFNGRTNEFAPGDTLVQVLGRPLGSEAEFQVVENSHRLSTFMTDGAGFFDGGFGGVPGVKEYDPAEIVVRAWSGARTWEAALTNMQAFVGQSPIFTNGTGQSAPFPGIPNPAQLTNFPSFTMYPFPQACRLVPFVGPRPLCLDVSTSGQTLVFTWADLGTNYVYTLEFKPSLAATNWTPVPGTTWPARTNQFLLANPPAGPSFYRVRAQVVQ